MKQNKYKDFAVKIAKKAGKIMKKNFQMGMAREWKRDDSPVTVTDTSINSLLIEQVKKFFPEHSVRGEEESNVISGSKFVWVCDPVDGTIPFSHAIPISTFSLALTENGQSILGVVYDPFMDRMYVASKGDGAFLNGKKILVNKSDKLRGMAANHEMFHSAFYDLSAIDKYLTYKEGVHLMRLKSYVYPSVLVAAGEFGFTLFPHTTAHDAAAVKIIVEEAGGKVTDIYGNEQRYDQDINGLVVSNGVIHDQLVELCKQLVVPNK